MERLSGLDAGFLAMGDDAHPATATHYVVFQGPPGADPPTVDDLAAHVHARLHLLPGFRRRAVRVPLGLHHPVWIEDPDFDLAHHLRVLRADAPGGERELEAAIARCAAWPVATGRPLWRATLIEGLAERCTAVVVTMHHGLSDARGIVTTLERLFVPDDQLVPPDAPWRPEPVPARARLVADALRDQRSLWGRLPALAKRTVAGFRAVEVRRAEAAVHAPRAEDVVPGPFNVTRVPERTFVRVHLPLADFKRVRRASGATMTDVVYALVTGALRRYLAEHGEPVDRPLIANNTVLTEPLDSPERTVGNHMNSLSIVLPVDEVDPWRRLQRIHEVIDEARLQFDLVGTTVLEDWLEFALPVLARPVGAIYRIVLRRTQGTEVGRPGFNVAASNVLGPRPPLALGSHTAVEAALNGMISPEVGLFVGMVGQGDVAVLPIMASTDALPDPDRLVAAYHAAHRELMDATAEHEAAALVGEQA